MMPRLYIVDDEAPARARLETLLTDIAAECPHELVGQAGDAQAALDGIAAARPDIVLLDIQMPGMSGIELAAHLARQDGAPAVIFVTAYDSYALKAFEVHAVDYLMKPVRAAKLAEAIRRAAAARRTQATSLAATVEELQVRRQNFAVQERGRLLLVPVAEVLFYRAEAKYVTLRTRTREYLIEESLSSIEEEFGAQLVRVHRNTLVARHAILGVERGVAGIAGDGEASSGESEKSQEAWQVILRDLDDRLPVSRRQWPIVKALLNR
ncbi:MAG: response regulator transcription factor [Burkholderiaceae bacterium]|nr:response regulator transcription factor [Burkholderiaceae bacterium]